MANVQIWTIGAVFGSFAILIIKIFVVLHYLPEVKPPKFWSIKAPKESGSATDGIINAYIVLRNLIAIIVNLLKGGSHLLKVTLTALSDPNFVKSLLDLVTDLILSLGVGFLATVLGGQNQIMGLVGALLSLFISALLTIGRILKGVGSK